MFKIIPLVAVIGCLCPFAEFVNIGLVFEDNDPNKSIVFNYKASSNLLEPLQREVSAGNSLETLDAVCSLLEEGVAGIFGSSSEENSDVIQTICDTLEISHIETRWNDKQQRGNTMINLHPHPMTLGQAYVDLVKAHRWRKFTIFYEDNEGLSRVTPLIKLNDGLSNYSVVARQLNSNSEKNSRPVLKEAWRSGHTNFVLDCNIESLEAILRQAQQVGLMTHIHKYLITNLDLHTIDLERYKHSGTKIKGIRIVNPNNEMVKNFVEEMEDEYEYSDNINIPPPRVQIALLADAVSLFSAAYSELEIPTKPLLCNSSDSWEHGLSLISYMKMKTINGLTGTVSMDHEGFRTEFVLDIVELKKTGIVEVGTWSASEGLKFSKTMESDGNLQNSSFNVIIALTDPYAMLKEASTSLQGNSRFEGFGIDLIHELSILEGFNYTFLVREDKSNGAYNKETGLWSGMIGDVMYGLADLAITDLTITAEREEGADFTSPFMTLGISILYQKPAKAPPNFFSFAEPFALEVWLCLGGAYFTVSVSLYIMGRLCPSEWTNPYPCIEEPEFLLNQFSLRNSFWFTIGSLMQQGSEIAPIAYSTRMVAGIWFFFTLIMVSSYTANLAACLATENPERPFDDVNELAARAEKAGIKYGAKANGATANFFRDSDSAVYRKIYDYMVEHEDVMVNENKDGVSRAESEKYAFFMESTSIEYEIQRHCNLVQVGGLLDEKGYGIAMRKNTTYRHLINTALLKLQSSGKIQALKRKWWEERRGGGQCSGDVSAPDSTPLTLKNVGGVFWVTFGGVCIAAALVFIEMVLHTMKVSIKQKTSLKEELIEELKFYFAFTGLVKTVRNRRADTKSPAESEKSLEKSPPTYGFLPDITKAPSS